MFCLCCCFVFVVVVVVFFGKIKQVLPLCEGNMTICHLSIGNIALGTRPRAILPASGEQIVMLPSNKGNNCIMVLFAIRKLILQTSILYDFLCEQRRLWRDCSDAQARLSLRWSPM